MTLSLLVYNIRRLACMLHIGSCADTNETKNYQSNIGTFLNPSGGLIINHITFSSQFSSSVNSTSRISRKSSRRLCVRVFVFVVCCAHVVKESTVQVSEGDRENGVEVLIVGVWKDVWGCPTDLSPYKL